MVNTDWKFPPDEKLFRHVVSERFDLKSSGTITETPAANHWKDNFCSVLKKGKLHGSFDYCFENAAYKICSLFLDTKDIRETEKKLVGFAEPGIKNPELAEFSQFGLNIFIGHLLLTSPASNK